MVPVNDSTTSPSQTPKAKETLTPDRYELHREDPDRYVYVWDTQEKRAVSIRDVVRLLNDAVVALSE